MALNPGTPVVGQRGPTGRAFACTIDYYSFPTFFSTQNNPVKWALLANVEKSHQQPRSKGKAASRLEITPADSLPRSAENIREMCGKEVETQHGPGLPQH